MRSAGMEKGTAAMAISVKRLGKTFVAAVDGVDLGRELDDATWSAIHRAYLDHKVLAFRGQDLSPAAYCAFASLPRRRRLRAARPPARLAADRRGRGRAVGRRR